MRRTFFQAGCMHEQQSVASLRPVVVVFAMQKYGVFVLYKKYGVFALYKKYEVFDLHKKTQKKEVKYMARTMLQKLFYCDIYPFEDVKPPDPDYTIKNNEYETYLKKIEQILGTDEFKSYEKLQADVNIMELEAMFAHGLKIGLFLMMELLSPYKRQERGN